MGLQGVIAIVVLAGAVIFGLLNQSLLYESQTVQLPGGTYTLPMVGILVAVAVGVVLLMLLADAATTGMWRRRHSRMADRLTARERELGDLKGRRYDEISAKIDTMREEIGQIAGRRRLETEPTQTVVR
ncbi:MAG: hypothetical protein ACREA0_21290, partial [bacterium]